MSKRSEEQSWIVNTLLAGNGYEVLHPESRHFLAELGYDPVDFDRALSRVKTGGQMPKAWSEIAQGVEAKAGWYEQQGFARTARNLFHRATLLWAHGRYAFPPQDDRRAAFQTAVSRCLEGVIRLSDERMEHVTVEFEGSHLYAIAHIPSTASDGPVPLVLMLPGMDMYKEDWTRVAQQYYLPRGIAVLAVDGPGQGQSYGGGLLATLDNYERAMGALITEMSNRPEIAEDRIGIWGVSMGSYWGLRTAAADKRVKAVATAMGCYGNTQTIFEKAQPGFKANFMRMSGYTDEETFDREVASKMGVSEVAAGIDVPVLMAYGEFDELSTLEETIALFEKIGSTKRLMVFEQEFHALGGVGAELIGSAADWLETALAGKLTEGSTQQDYIGRDGRIRAGSAVPPWWAAPAQA